MDTLDYLLQRFGITKMTRTMPVIVPDIGREDLAMIFGELGFKTGVEIGVLEGEYSEVLCKANPGLKLYSVDPWLVRDDYHDFRDQEVFNEYEKKARERLAPYNCVIVKDFSLNAVNGFEDNSLDFVYIDGHHDFKNCALDIIEWTPKIRIGGIISGHDYARFRWPYKVHVVEVVNAYTAAYHIKPWFVLGTKERIEGQKRDKYRSFLWVKV